jgi:hypothetical protein
MRNNLEVSHLFEQQHQNEQLFWVLCLVLGVNFEQRMFGLFHMGPSQYLLFFTWNGIEMYRPNR